MHDGYTTLYVRRRFSLPDPHRYRRFVLSVHADDAFVTYLNGVELCRVGAPLGTPIPFDAVSKRNADEPLAPSSIRLDPDAVQAGENVLAIQGLNKSNQSSDFSLIPELRGILPPDEERDREILGRFRAVATR